MVWGGVNNLGESNTSPSPPTSLPTLLHHSLLPQMAHICSSNHTIPPYHLLPDSYGHSIAISYSTFHLPHPHPLPTAYLLIFGILGTPGSYILSSYMYIPHNLILDYAILKGDDYNSDLAKNIMY